MNDTTTLANSLNGVVGDIVGHGGNIVGLRFFAQGPATAYLSVPGDPKGAVVVSWELGDTQIVVFFHPERTGKEAFDMSKEPQGLKKLCEDEMDEERFPAKPEVYTPNGVPAGMYDVVQYCAKKFASYCGKSPFGKENPDEAYF